MSDLSQSGRAIAFIGLAFLFSWSIGLWIFNSGLRASDPGFGPMVLLFMWGPLLSAVVCAVLFEKGRRIASLGLRWRWRGLGRSWFAAIAQIFLTVSLVVLLTGVMPGALGEGLHGMMKDTMPEGMGEGQVPPESFVWTLLVVAAIVGPVVNLPLILSEELGWRGYMWDALRERTFLQQNLAIGLVWGVWHFPLVLMGYNFGEDALIGCALMAVFCMASSVTLGHLREVSGTVWSGAMWHATFNTIALVPTVVFPTLGFTIAGAVGLVATVVAIALALLTLSARARHGVRFANGADRYEQTRKARSAEAAIQTTSAA